MQQAGPWQETDAHFPLCWEGGNGLSESPHHGTCLLSRPSERKQPRLPLWGENKHANKKANIKARSVSQTPPRQKVQLRHIELPDNSCRASFQSRNRPGVLTTYLKKLGNAGDAGSVPGSGRSPGEGNGNPLQHSCLGDPTGGAWRATAQGSQRVGHDWLTEHTPTEMKDKNETKKPGKGKQWGKKIDSQSYTRMCFLYETKSGLALKGAFIKPKQPWEINTVIVL